MLLFLSTLVLLIWFYLLLFHAGFWQMDYHLLPGRRSNSFCRVAAIIPARNEADVIAQSITSLLTQNFVGSLHLFVVDDHSSDSTAEVAKAAVDLAGAAGGLTVISSAPLPPGWLGKVWAVQQGWLAARESRPDYVLLTDADIEHAPDNLSRLLAQAQSEQADLTSVLVRLRCDTIAEKLLIPAFVYFFFLLYPPAKTANSGSRTAGAAGGCMLLRASAIELAGGFESIRGEIIDDCSLAARIKQAGGRLWLGITDETRSLRGYGSFAGLRAMIARTAFNQLRHSIWLLIGCVLGILLLFVLPIALLWSHSLTVQVEAAVALGFMMRTYLPAVRLNRLNPAWTLTLPLAAIFFGYATICSAANYWRGRGGQWKGRAQDR